MFNLHIFSAHGLSRSLVLGSGRYFLGAFRFHEVFSMFFYVEARQGSQARLCGLSASFCPRCLLEPENQDNNNTVMSRASGAISLSPNKARQYIAELTTVCSRASALCISYQILAVTGGAYWGDYGMCRNLLQEIIIFESLIPLCVSFSLHFNPTINYRDDQK